METNNSNTTVINENDVFSEESTYIDYSNIPDYTAAEYTNNYKTLSIQQFSIAFLNLLKQAYSESTNDIWYFYLIDNNEYQYHISEIDNLDNFILWDGNYINDDSNIEMNKLLSFKTLKNKISFKVSYRCKIEDDNSVQNTLGLGTPVITNVNILETKIISVNDLNYGLYFPIDYFNIYDCFNDYITPMTCDALECDAYECDAYECDINECDPDICYSDSCYMFNPIDCFGNECAEVSCSIVDCDEFDCDFNNCDAFTCDVHDDCDVYECDWVEQSN